jgi:hypothetical protein
VADLDPIVSQAIRRIDPGAKEHESRLKRYDHAYDVYRATPRPNTATQAWQSKLSVPFAMQVIDTGLVNIVSGKPRIMVKARRPEFELGAKAMQLALDYYVGEDHLVEKQPTFVQQGLIYGVTAAKNHWLYREAKRPIKTFSHNPLDPTMPLDQVSLQNMVVRDGPTFEPWDIYHCFWEPGARDVDSAAYVVLQSYVSKEDLLQLRFNPETGQGIYKNVDQLLASGSGPQPRESAQSRALSLQANRYKDKFLIEEIWTDDELVVIGNRQVLLRRQPNPYWHGKKPVVVTQTRPDLFEMVGISETETVDHLQQALHTVQNMRFDNLHLTVMRGITYREGGVTDPNMLELRPRFKWPVSDHDDIRPFEVQPLPPEAYGEENNLISRMQLVTGINPYISGADLQTVDQNTATGVTALQEVASRLLRFKAAQIQYKGYQRSFEMWGDMVQQFLDKNLQVEIIGPGNQSQWVDIPPHLVAGHFNYAIEGSEESLSRQQERGEAIALLNAFAPLAQLGTINFKPILERVAMAYDFPNPEALFNQPPPQQPAAPSQDPQQFFNVRSPQIGDVPAFRQNESGLASATQPQGLANALALIGNGATRG